MYRNDYASLHFSGNSSLLLSPLEPNVPPLDVRRCLRIREHNIVSPRPCRFRCSNPFCLFRVAELPRDYVTPSRLSLLDEHISPPFEPTSMPPAGFTAVKSQRSFRYESDSDDSLQGQPSQNPRFSVELGPYEILRQLATCEDGQTLVARELQYGREGGRVLCFKSFRKRDVVDRKRVEIVVRELVAYKRLASLKRDEGRAFVMDLDASVQDSRHLYFAMELMQYDLLVVLNRQVPGRGTEARRWIAQTASGLAAIHRAGIIHRDIKPENLLIDYQNNIRICDFGSAYTHTNAPLHPYTAYIDTVSGTFDYMAPEVFANLGLPKCDRRSFGIAADYWSLGCIMFDLEGEEEDTLFNSEEELNHYLKWNPAANAGLSFISFAGLSEQAEEVISGLIRPNPIARYGIADLIGHPYFQRLDGTSEFDNIERRAFRRPRVNSTIVENDDEEFIPECYPTVEAPWGCPDALIFDQLGWINPSGVLRPRGMTLCT